MIKNYTSEVPVERTISKIEAVLVKAGAVGIMKEYKDGQLDAVCFSILADEGRLIGIKLPGNIDNVYETMKKSIIRPKSDTMKRLRAQAERTGWKLVQDWVEVQMSLIEIQKVELLQMFLPHVYDGEKTFYAHLKEQGFKLLPISASKTKEGKEK